MKELLKKIALYGVISSFALVLAVPASAADRTDGKYRTGDDDGDGIACTMDAKQCPDGTYVGRTGSNCEFVCPAGTVTGSGPGATVGSTSPAVPPSWKIQIQEKRVEIKDQMEKAREVFKQKREDAEDKFEAAREEYKKRVEEAKQSRTELTTSIKESVKVKSQETKDKTVAKANSMLGNTVRAMVQRLEALKNKVNGVKLLEADKKEILAEIDKDIAWLNTKSAEVQVIASSTTATSTASTTVQTIKNKAKEVKVYWDTVKVTVKRVSGEILAGRLNYIVNKEEELVNSLTSEIAVLKTAGKDVASLEQSLADAKTKIATAKTKIAEAKTKFKTITSLDTAKSIYESGKTIIKDASKIVKEVHVALIKVRNGANAINGNNGNGTVATTTTATTTPTP